MKSACIIRKKGFVRVGEFFSVCQLKMHQGRDIYFYYRLVCLLASAFYSQLTAPAICVDKTLVSELDCYSII